MILTVFVSLCTLLTALAVGTVLLQEINFRRNGNETIAIITNECIPEVTFVVNGRYQRARVVYENNGVYQHCYPLLHGAELRIRYVRQHFLGLEYWDVRIT